MNVIGRTMRGGVIVEVEQCEYVALLEAGHALALLPAVNSEVVLTHPPEVSGPVGPLAVNNVRKPLSPILKAIKAAKSGVRLCVICEKPLPKNCSPLRAVHAGECLKLQNRKRAADSWRKKHGKTAPVKVAAEPVIPPTLNPADPTLTDEQRKAARLELIKRAAEKYN